MMEFILIGLILVILHIIWLKVATDKYVIGSLLLGGCIALWFYWGYYLITHAHNILGPAIYHSSIILS